MVVVKDKIEAIRERLDIVQVIGSYVVLKKKGQRYSGLCPFHTENTPSFSVSQEKGVYYCFGCQESGDVFSFVMKREGLEFHEALRKLGEQVGITLEPESPEKIAQRKAEDEVNRVNQFALAYFRQALSEPKGKAARDYLVSRGVPEVLANDWRLGFGGAPGELIKYFTAKNVPKELVQKAGFFSDDGSRTLFEERLVFPVFDTVGRLSGFGGRRLGDYGPKYLNTRDSPLFKKSKLLFGYEHAEGTIRRTRRVVIVEGYMDVIACHAAGVTGAVAALGTAFTEDHARQVARFAKDAVVLMDADSAGQAASLNVTERLLSEKVTTLLARLPEGKDPDELVQAKGPDALKEVVDNAVPALEQLILHTFHDSMSIEARAEAAKTLAPLLLALGPGLTHDLYVARLAEVVGVTPEQLTRHLKSVAPKKKPAPATSQSSSPNGATTKPEAGPPQRSAPQQKATPEPPAPKLSELDGSEITMLGNLLLYPELRKRLGDLAEYADTDVMREVLEALSQTDASLAEIVTKHLGTDRRAARLAAIKPALEDEETAQRAQKTYDDVLAQMKKKHVRAAKDGLKRELSLAVERGEDTTELLARLRDLDRRERAL